MSRTGKIVVDDGVELFYRDSGRGRPIVFIHGIWASSRFFDHQIEALSRRFRVVAFDLRGHGQSAMTLKGQTIGTYARDLGALLKALRIEKPVLVGWSLGAFVIWEFIRRFGPGDIAGTVIIDQAPTDLKSAAEPDGLISVETLAAWHRRTLEDRAGLVNDLIPMMFAHPPAEHDQRWMFEEMTRAPEAIAAAILVEQTFQDYRDVLDGCPLPTLVCYGERSPQPKASMAWIARAARSGESREFKDCGHCLFLEASEEFNGTVEAYVERLPGG